MQINVTYDSSVSDAPDGFQTAVEAAVQYLEDTLSTPITLNISIGWGEAGGQDLPSGAVGVSSSYAVGLNYDEVRNALWADAKTPDALAAAMALPSTDPTNGGSFLMSTAEAKALGLLAADDAGLDGVVGLDSSTQFTFDPNNREVPGMVDGIGVLIHEITHLLGRQSYLGYLEGDGTTLYSPMDLFRYTAPGVLSPSSAAAHFSVDGQTLLLPFNNPLNGGDADDWSSTLTGDAFDAFVDVGIKEEVSGTDLKLMDVLGFHGAVPTPITPTPGVTPTDTVDITSAHQVAQGQTVYSTDDPGRSFVWAITDGGPLTNAGTIAAISNLYASDVAAVWGEADTSPFINTVTGTVYAKATGSNAIAYGFEGHYNSPDVENAGLFQVVSLNGNAIGSYHAGNNPTFTNDETGIVKVWSGMTGIGVDYNQGGSFDNAGIIDVTGHDAIGVRGATSFVNSGTIRATDTGIGGTGSIAVALYSASFPGPTGNFTNTGLIQGDFAFYSNMPYAYSANFTLSNSGTIIGASYLGDSNAHIQNTGIIGGNLFLGNSTNVYDGASGHLYGAIYLSLGDDTITLGNDNAIVYGGGGTATITGGSGNDFFEIPRGSETIDGGAGFNTLSFDNADIGATVDLGAGTASAAGADTIANIQQVIGSNYDDTLKAGTAAAILVAGAGHDVLIGGAGNDTLVAGTGNDTITGGGGNDAIIYSTGDGQLTVTDFRANGGNDTLKIDGYTSAQSVHQQGADTLITLSGGDSILLKNVQTSALNGSNVIYNGAAYAGSPVPYSAPSFGHNTIFVDQDLHTFAGEVINETEQSVGLYGRGYNFDNSASIAVNYATSTVDDYTFGFLDSIFDKNGNQLGADQIHGLHRTSITNESGAHLDVANSTGGAIGIESSWADITNAGEISVTAGGWGKGLEGAVSDFKFVNTASGVLTVDAAGWAFGIDIENDAIVQNDGTIAVTGGDFAYGLRMGREEGRAITNSGLITATATNEGGHAYAIAIAGQPDFFGAVTTITNNGTITATDAIYEYDDGGSPTTFPYLNIDNSGTINGDITLRYGPDQIKNTGHIAGIIHFGDGDVTYDGASGTLAGAIYLGYGTNSVKLGNDGETVFANSNGGFDTITGGSGNDFIEIARGVNAINGGGGFNTLSFALAAGGVRVDLGAGTASGTGNDTITNIQEVIGSSRADTLIAAAAGSTLVGGAGDDTLTGKAGNDTLIGGPGNDKATGGGGNDNFVFSAGDDQLVITDFGAGGNHDALKIYGYTSALSVHQQGADTLITLSATDTILLQNVQASSLSGSNVVYSAGSLPDGPALPPPPPVFGTVPIDFLYDLQIYAGEKINLTGPTGLINDGNVAYPATRQLHSLDNAGSITVASPTGDVIGMDSQGALPQNGMFTNEASGTFSVSAAAGNATGLHSNTSPGFLNAGSFTVTGSASAYGLMSAEPESSYKVTNAHTGVWTVSSSSGDAVGAELSRGGTFQNDGTLYVHGSTNAYGVWQGGFQDTIINTGAITVVTDASGGAEYGLLVGADTPVYATSGAIDINNSGTITAKTAIFVPLLPYSDTVTLTNSGTINGDIDLGTANQDVVTNTGTINGDILLHSGIATIDMRGGTLTGDISITPSANLGLVRDTIYTGSNDTTIRIHSGDADVSMVEDTVAVVGGASGYVTVEFDIASSQATITKNDNGSWTVSAGTDGTETLTNVDAIRFTDKLVGLTDPNPGDTVFDLGATLTAASQIDGGTGFDTVNLNGDYATTPLVFGAMTMVNVERMVLSAGHSYSLTTNDATVAAGQSLAVDATALGTGNILKFDGSHETNGKFSVTGGAGADTITGGAGNDTLDGRAGNDYIQSGAGTDTLRGGDGDDTFNFGGTLASTDQVDGGAGSDKIYLNGDYAAGVVFGATTMVNVERMVLSAGHSYSLTTNDATVAAGQSLAVDATALGTGNILKFDGSHETNGKFSVTGGAGADTITGGAGNDTLDGRAGNDYIQSGAGTDILRGGDGDDTFNFGGTLASTDQVDGGAGSDKIYLNGDYAAGVVFGATTMVNVERMVLSAGHSYSLTTNDATVAAGQSLAVDATALGTGNILKFDGSHETNGKFSVTGGAGADTITGGAGNDTLDGRAGNDYIQSGAGTDILRGGDGDDTFNFGGTLASTDQVDGGAGSDKIYLNGDYAAGVVFGATTMVNVERMVLSAGHSYSLTTNDATVAAGQSLAVDATALGTGNILKFDGSHETNGKFSVTGGAGADTITGGAGNDTLDGRAGNDYIQSGAGTDTLRGGDGDDTFNFGGTLASTDQVDGGAGSDKIYLNGDYAAGVVFGATTMVNVERMVLSAGHSYSLTTNDATVAAGQSLAVDGSQLGASDTFIFNGSAETNGHFVIRGGAGADVLTGGAGADTFVYTAAAQSTGSHFDTIHGFDFSLDKFDLPGTVTGIDNAVSSGALNSASFDTNLANDIGAGQLAAHHAVLFTPDSGSPSFAGQTFLIVDENGAAGYQAGQDLVLLLDNIGHLANFGTGDFV